MATKNTNPLVLICYITKGTGQVLKNEDGKIVTEKIRYTIPHKVDFDKTIRLLPSMGYDRIDIEKKGVLLGGDGKEYGEDYYF